MTSQNKAHFDKIYGNFTGTDRNYCSNSGWLLVTGYCVFETVTKTVIYNLAYKHSDMKLTVHSNASYLSKPNACSHAGGHFFLSFNEQVPRNNTAILNITHIIKHVMSSATEA